MATPSISKEMLNYFMQLNDAERKSVLEMVKTFLSSRKNEVKPQSLEEYNRELEQADAEIEAGNYVPHEEVMKRYLKK
jgi:predicted transcriptional regulator